MRNRYTVHGAAAARLLLFAVTLAGASVRAADPMPGLKDPSVQIVFDLSNAVPTSGTVGPGMCMFRVERGPGVDLAAIDERLRTALKTGFAQKNFGYAEEEPDYLVSYALAVGARIDEAELNRAYGDFLVLPAAATNGVDGLYYERGVLIVDVVDRKAKHLLWRGAIMAELDMQWPDARKQERCDAAVAELLRYFPRPPQPAAKD